MSVIQSKAARQDHIARLLTKHAVRSQSELADLLAADGIETTQATLSRDLVDMRAQKIRNDKGVLVYAIPAEGAAGAILGVTSAPDLAGLEARFARLAGELVITAESAENLVVLRTPAGAAHYLASALDRSLFSDVLGSVAGDDTVLIVLRSAKAATNFLDTVLAHTAR